MPRIKKGKVITKDDKISAFVRNYLKHYNATEAAIAAKYAPNSAHVSGSRLLKDAKVQALIAEAEKRFENRIFISKEKILKELALIGFSAIDDHLEIGEGGLIQAKTFEEMPPGAVRCIKKIKEKRVIRTEKGTKDKPDGEEILDSTFEFELHDKIQALINMGKELGMFREKKEFGLDDKTIDLILAALPKDYADAVKSELMKMKGE